MLLQVILLAPAGQGVKKSDSWVLSIHGKKLQKQVLAAPAGKRFQV